MESSQRRSIKSSSSFSLSSFRLSLEKFHTTVMDAQLCQLDDAVSKPVRDSWWDGYTGHERQIRLVVALNKESRCGGGIEVFPAGEFIGIVALGLAAWAMSGAFLFALVSRPCPVHEGDW